MKKKKKKEKVEQNQNIRVPKHEPTNQAKDFKKRFESDSVESNMEP